MKVYRNLFDKIISLENLFIAWRAFRSNKSKRRDVRAFEWRLEENIFQLHRELKTKTYRHGPYSGFYINDPKRRHIHKATVRDRVLHHAIYSVISPIFERTFIPYSFSCRIGFGTHRGVRAIENMARQVSRNGTRPCWALKCDVQKFFDSVDHDILLTMLKRRIKDADTVWLLREIINGFSLGPGPLFGSKGLPIGNLTSQLFANVYLNELDQFMKQTLHIRHYARYTDDFIILDADRESLEQLIPVIGRFLTDHLALTLHPKKVEIRKFNQGIDFLGYVVLPWHTRLRTRTKRRMFTKLRQRIREREREYSWQS